VNRKSPTAEQTVSFTYPRYYSYFSHLTGEMRMIWRSFPSGR